jgi:LytS/YehU family sensor histidine kinase
VARRENGPGGPRLRVTVSNTGAPLSPTYRRGGDHVGLDHVDRRLAGHYRGAASITLTADSQLGTIAELLLPLVEARTMDEESDAKTAASRAGGR